AQESLPHGPLRVVGLTGSTLEQRPVEHQACIDRPSIDRGPLLALLARERLLERGDARLAGPLTIDGLREQGKPDDGVRWIELGETLRGLATGGDGLGEAVSRRLGDLQQHTPTVRILGGHLGCLAGQIHRALETGRRRGVRIGDQPDGRTAPG
ncbi:MAG: hypothetical protein ACK55I_34145, partial [bacterium]